MDYASWVRRAEAFARKSHYLPGQWGISIAVDPPATTSEIEDLARSLPFGLPASLKKLYTEGAAGCCCKYHWTPNDVERVQTVFPHERSFYGGAQFIRCAELPQADGLQDCWDEQREDFSPAQAVALDIARHAVPFIQVANGDCICLHVADANGEIPVVYLSHDDPEDPVTKLGPCLEQFLMDWESLCYIGPEIWLLSAFLNEEGNGSLDAKSPLALRWRDVIMQKK